MCYLNILKLILKIYVLPYTFIFFNDQCLNHSNINYSLILYPEMLTFNIVNKRSKALAIT